MAKISSCFQLCPLIDQKSFLGVSYDCDGGHIIVTLGRNIAIRYRLSDQKQVKSWTFKVRLSSPVVFDKKTKQYVGLFNTNTIQMWGDSDADLSKVKKYKFNNSIHSILTCGTSDDSTAANNAPLVIVFKDGRIAPLTPATLVNRKNIAVICHGMAPIIDKNLNEGETIIEDVQMLLLNDNVVVVMITVDTLSGTSTCHLIPLQNDLFERISFVLADKSHSESCDRKLTGYAFIGGETLKVLTLWSDGSLHCLELYLSNLQDVSTLFPGEEIMKVSSIKTNLKVAVLPLDNGCNIAVYGSDPSEEGALLVIINIRHKLVQCKYNFKLYCTSPKLWSGGPTDLLLLIGQNLAVAHYRLMTQKLASLVGTQQNDTVAPANALVWEKKTKKKSHENGDHSMMEVDENVIDKTPESDTADLCDPYDYICHPIPIDGDRLSDLNEMVSTLSAKGLSESGIVCKTVSTLIELQNTADLAWLFKLHDDVPLDSILATLKYCLLKHNLKPKSKMNDDETSMVTAGKNSEEDYLLRIVLQKSVVADSKALLLIRKEISLSMSIELIKYLIQFMIEYPCNMRLINWATLLLDSFYQSYIISKDKAMVNTMNRLNGVVENQITLMTTWHNLVPLIQMVKNKRGVPKSMSHETADDLMYSLDSINLN